MYKLSDPIPKTFELWGENLTLLIEAKLSLEGTILQTGSYLTKKKYFYIYL
jgi:hypothetical protein